MFFLVERDEETLRFNLDIFKWECRHREKRIHAWLCSFNIFPRSQTHSLANSSVLIQRQPTSGAHNYVHAILWMDLEPSICRHIALDGVNLDKSSQQQNISWSIENFENIEMARTSSWNDRPNSLFDGYPSHNRKEHIAFRIWVSKSQAERKHPTWQSRFWEPRQRTEHQSYQLRFDTETMKCVWWWSSTEQSRGLCTPWRGKLSRGHRAADLKPIGIMIDGSWD